MTKTSSSSLIQLPIEGVSPWPKLIRLIAMGSVVSILLMAFLFLFLIPPDNLQIEPENLLIGASVMFLFEIVLVRRLIVPVNGDYGRYRIFAEHVDLYPLSSLGFTTLTTPRTILMSAFTGLVVESGESGFTVALMHPQRANMVRIKNFPDKGAADEYMRMLGEVLPTKTPGTP